MDGRSSQLVRSRGAAVEELAVLLPKHAALFVRLLRQQVPLDGASTTTLHMLARLEERPFRVGELVETEGLAQPTVTLLVAEAEARGWVKRVRDADDRRVVNVHITEQGRQTIEEGRARFQAVLADILAGLPDEELERLRGATQTLGGVTEALQERGGGVTAARAA
ncbi:MAG TPA: MarR family transcriptional regulator [Gaiellaceae bacterium]